MSEKRRGSLAGTLKKVNKILGYLHLILGQRLMKRNKPLSMTSAAATVGPSGCFALTVIA